MSQSFSTDQLKAMVAAILADPTVLARLQTLVAQVIAATTRLPGPDLNGLSHVTTHCYDTHGHGLIVNGGARLATGAKLTSSARNSPRIRKGKPTRPKSRPSARRS
jgi:hypothetical protein